MSQDYYSPHFSSDEQYIDLVPAQTVKDPAWPRVTQGHSVIKASAGASSQQAVYAQSSVVSLGLEKQEDQKVADAPKTMVSSKIPFAASSSSQANFKPAQPQQFDMYYGSSEQPDYQDAPAKKQMSRQSRLCITIMLIIAAIALVAWLALVGVKKLSKAVSSGDKTPAQATGSLWGKDWNTGPWDVEIDPDGNASITPQVTTSPDVQIAKEWPEYEPSQGDWQKPTQSYRESYYYVQAEGGLNMRRSPSTSSDWVGNIPDGTAIAPIEWDGNWAYVYYGGYGWVSGDYLRPAESGAHGSYRVKADGGLNMRSQPTTSSTVIVNIPNGSTLEVTSWDGQWASVSWNGYSGWCHGDYLVQAGTSETAHITYSQAQVDRAIEEAKAYYASCIGASPKTGLTGQSLTHDQVEALYWNAVACTTVGYYPAGQFSQHGEYLYIDGRESIYIQVSDNQFKTLGDWANKFYSVLSDEEAYRQLCYNCLFMLDGKMYISAGAFGDEGLGTNYTIRIAEETDGYQLTMDVVNTRYNWNDTVEEIKWSATFHCFLEDGVWVFNDAQTPYQ